MVHLHTFGFKGLQDKCPFLKFEVALQLAIEKIAISICIIWSTSFVQNNHQRFVH